MLEHVPAERRPHMNAGTPEQAAEALQPYLDAGFTGFTFNNTIYRTPERSRTSASCCGWSPCRSPVAAQRA